MSLSEPEAAMYRQIQVKYAWSFHRAASGIAVACGGRAREGCGVKPSRGGSLRGIKVGIAKPVGPLRDGGTGVYRITCNHHCFPGAVLQNQNPLRTPAAQNCICNTPGGQRLAASEGQVIAGAHHETA